MGIGLRFAAWENGPQRMKVLITGATGYVGGAVALALLNGANEVTGTGRDEKKAQALIAHGMRFQRASLEDLDALRRLAGGFDVVIHAAMAEDSDAAAKDEAATKALVEACTAGRTQVFVYTSSTWVLGSGGPFDEQSPPNPIARGAWRKDLEPWVTQRSSERLRTNVIRPARVYGGAGGAFAPWFEAALKGEQPRVLATNPCWAVVHREDLGDLYRRVVESGAPGAVYNASDDTAHRERELASVMAAAAGAAGISEWSVDGASKVYGGFAHGLAIDQHVQSPASRKLGWIPRHTDVLKNADRLYDEYVAKPPES